ncbi:hypothetical protein HNY73_001327 [Argiope bruennichi]|uniref:Uncharacterized protein n=1 Tax=Argiope bruennichi TaxID=94029 RepID=A0A8T0G1B7_ARGBR|nr:hypothetical protein HNY73_001327 [Argiope bruennichi]
MALIFIPSLQHIAAVKVALAVYNDDIEHFLDEFIETEDIFNYGNSFRISECQTAKIKERKNEIGQKLSTLLPKLLTNPVGNILQPIVAEIFYWVRDHYHVIKYIHKRHIMNNLRWKSEGTIDRIKTSKQLIRNENIDIRVRFIFACLYFYEQDVLELWQSMTAEGRESIHRIDCNLAVRFWVKWLRNRAVSPWAQWIPDYLNFQYGELITSGSNHGCRRIRISSFYIELSCVNKKKFLHSMWPRHAHIDDLRICYYLTDETERDKIFHNPGCVFESKTKDLLCFYLDWPFQTIFLDVVNQMWDHLTPDCFEHLLRFIVCQKLLQSMEDFDYLSGFKKLWNRTPNSYKEQIRKRRAFLVFKEVLNYDENTSYLPLEEKLHFSHNMNERTEVSRTLKDVSKKKVAWPKTIADDIRKLGEWINLTT